MAYCSVTKTYMYRGTQLQTLKHINVTRLLSLRDQVA